MMHPIDYELIGKAIAQYKSMGYEYLETQWWVSQEAQFTTALRHGASYVIDSATRDEYGDDVWTTPVGHLVGSAEQSLIQKILDVRVSPGLYVMAGPCFRNELVVDELRHQSFFKVELACVFLEGTLPSKDVFQVMKDAQLVHRNVGNVIPEVVSMQDEQGYDLEVGGVEVGSYGQRTLNGIGWVYGTGLALPRFTQAIGMKK